MKIRTLLVLGLLSLCAAIRADTGNGSARVVASVDSVGMTVGERRLALASEHHGLCCSSRRRGPS